MMKLKKLFLTVSLATGISSTLMAQTDATAAKTNGGMSIVASTVAPGSTNEGTAVATEPAATPTTAPAPAPAPDTNAAPAAPVTPPASSMTISPSAHDPNGIIPLIVMDEVPLTDAIKNLARQAGLNYMLDPKINYGTPDANGAVHQQPTVSLRWENLTADQALAAVLNNYNLVSIDDPKTRISRITIKDPAAPDPLVTKIIQLKYASASNIVMNVIAVLNDKRSHALSDIRTSQLIVVSTEKEMASIDELVTRLDTPTKQVLIEARLVEMSKNPATAKGVDWSKTLQAQNISFGNNVVGGSTGHPYDVTKPATAVNNPLSSPGVLVNDTFGLDPATAFLNADGLSAVLSFLNTDSDAKVLSTPRAVTLDNEEAVLSVTTAEPIFQTTAGTQGSPGGSTVTYTNVGTILHVTPRISANDSISLRVVPEVSDVAGVVTKTISGTENQADRFDVRKIETRVLIPSGNTLVMGGLVSDNSTKDITKVPLLGDIPLLGWAFRSESKKQAKKNLMIFVTPTIVKDDDFQPTPSTFLKTKIPSVNGFDFGSWDKGAKQDWSKLVHPSRAVPDNDAVDLPSTN